MSSRKHDRTHFFKYAARSTALRVIASKRFRWSSPTKFNDPFDHQVGFSPDIDKQRFAALLTASSERVIFTDIEVPAGVSVLSDLSLKLRSIRDRLDRKKVLEELHQSAEEVAANLEKHFDKFNTVLHEQLCHSRVFCVAEQHDNVVMWSHYAEEHRGVVFKLRCVDEIDNTLLAAGKVQYTARFIPFLTEEVYTKHLTGEQRIDLIPLIWEIAFTKHIDWAYEREWRVHVALLNEPAGDGYATYKEDERVFEAIYLGCRMEPGDVQAICKHAKEYLPQMKIYKAEKSRRAFALTFSELP
jgi:hypothetical protein